MTYETCKRLAEHCKTMKDEAGAKMYEDRANKKKPEIQEKEKSKKSK